MAEPIDAATVGCMKRPETDAEWDALCEADERELAATRTKDEWWAVYRRQAARDRAWGPFETRDAFEVLDEIRAELAARYPDHGRAEGPS
jgi:hypothetical protein